MDISYRPQIKPEHQEYWDDYQDGREEEFLAARNLYLSALKNQHQKLDKYLQFEMDFRKENPENFPMFPSPDATEEMSGADKDVHNARVRFKKTLVSLQNISVEECLTIVSQIDLMQGLNPDKDVDVEAFVQRLAISNRFDYH